MPFTFQNFHRTLLAGTLIIGATFLSVAGPQDAGRKQLSKAVQPQLFDLRAFQPNRIKTDVSNSGNFVSWFRTGDAGMEWPAGSRKTINFASGIWVLGKVDGEIRSAVAEFSTEFVPGTVVNGVPQDPEDPRFRIYIITREDEQAALDDNPRTAPGRDYVEWPFEDGAPALKASDGNDSLDAEGRRIPLLLGDRSLWCVFNDFDTTAHENLWDTPPLGIEGQMHLWGYKGPGALRDVLFVRFVLINKGPNRIDSTFIGIWDDADIGVAGDDFVGIDTTLQMGYFWNDGPDWVYGTEAPALGYDLLQGPLVPSPGDTARFFGRIRPGYRNLPITFFFRNVKHGRQGDPADVTQAYFQLQNRDRYGDPVVDPLTGEPVRFGVPGDPVTKSGWYDGIDVVAADRRLLISSGPFTFAPGDTQEVIVAVMVAQGEDNIESIVRLRELDQGVQALFDLWKDFQRGAQLIPQRPPAPDVRVAELSERLVLSWDDRAEGFASGPAIDEAANGSPGYRFEGYNVYQLDQPDPERASFLRLMATFDLVNGIRNIRDFVFDPRYGEEVEVTVQRATDSGLRHFLVIERDSLLQRPLVDGHRYYFGVSSYAYSPVRVGSILPHRLESPIAVVEAVPHDPIPGTAMQYGLLDTVAFIGPEGSRNAEREGKSMGSVVALAIDPVAIPTASYEVTFEKELGQIVWNLSRDGTRVLTGQRNQSGDWNYPVVDGLLVKVIGPPLTIAFNENNEAAGMVEVMFNGQPLTPDDFDNAGRPFGGNTVWHSLNHRNDIDRYYVSAGGGSGQLSRLTRSIVNAVPRDFEFRFTDEGSYGWWKFEGSTTGPVPFELWDIGIATPDDPSDDVRLIPILYSDGHTSGVYEISDQTPDRTYGYPATDWVYFYFDSRGYEAFAADAMDGTMEDSTFGELEYIARMIIADFDQDGELPPSGTVIRINTTKPNLVGDKFTFYTKGAEYRVDLARNEIQRINVFPNPYYAHNLDETDPLDRFVTFTRLPERATIRIFTLAGDLVRKLEHDDASTFHRWDLRNEAGVSVASGIYLVLIDMPGLGQKVLKLAVFQPVEIPEFYTPTPRPGDVLREEG
jgi:hypothetical protein